MIIHLPTPIDTEIITIEFEELVLTIPIAKYSKRAYM